MDAPGSQIHEVGTLPEIGLSYDAFAAYGYHYAIISDQRYGRYYTEKERYPEAIAFYESLFADALLIQAFPNSLTKPGPNIRVYQLAP
ncbi:MAG: hypothetical protein P1S60_03645 [Anaerolineae bacterium]|nr:hypothetical protein [Anaerolineae bacterium]